MTNFDVPAYSTAYHYEISVPAEVSQSAAHYKPYASTNNADLGFISKETKEENESFFEIYKETVAEEGDKVLLAGIGLIGMFFASFYLNIWEILQLPQFLSFIILVSGVITIVSYYSFTPRKS